MSLLLPPFIAIKSPGYGQYLNYNNDADSELYGSLKFSGNNVFSPLAKFEVVQANTGTGKVHIRCSHNKKFLRTLGETSGYISPEADEPEEDESKWWCTLFEPKAVDDNPDRVRLFHVQRHKFPWVGTVYTSNGTSARFYVGGDYEGVYSHMEIINLKSLVILPGHVAFKGDNGNYLGRDGKSLRFDFTDKGTATAWFEVSTDGDGRSQIKSYENQNFLRYDEKEKGLYVDKPDNSTRDQTTFWPVKVDRNVVALRSFANNNFCGRIENKTYLDAVFPTITKEARLTLEELVLSRKIYNADFDLDNAVIYGETPITMATATSKNDTPENSTVEFKFSYTESKSSTWTTSQSMKQGMTVEAEFKVPFFGTGGKVSLSGEYSESYDWGATITSENTLETTYSVDVPANSSVSVSLMATKGSCDVPYSYYQLDQLYNGKTVVYKKDDGLYTGVNTYNFKYEVVEKRKEQSKTGEPTTVTEYMEDKMVLPFEASLGFLEKTIEEKVHVLLPKEELIQKQNLVLPSEEMPDIPA